MVQACTSWAAVANTAAPHVLGHAAALFVPCHRVVRTDGSLGGFRYGLAIKERLIARESGLAGS